MFFRFAVVICSLIGLALVGVSIEKNNLAWRRAISVQEYQHQQLQKERIRLKLEIERLSAPGELLKHQPVFTAERPTGDSRIKVQR